jgi:hypothetical protein
MKLNEMSRDGKTQAETSRSAAGHRFGLAETVEYVR